MALRRIRRRRRRFATAANPWRSPLSLKQKRAMDGFAAYSPQEAAICDGCEPLAFAAVAQAEKGHGWPFPRKASTSHRPPGQ